MAQMPRGRHGLRLGAQPAGDSEYQLGYDMGFALAKAGYTVITAAVRATWRQRTRARGTQGRVGRRLHRATEREAQPLRDALASFRYFFVRKVMFVKYSQAFVILRRLWHAGRAVRGRDAGADRARCGPFPVVLAGNDGYWDGLVGWIRGPVVARGMV